MTLPMSSYEELLDQVRKLNNETNFLREQLLPDDSLLFTGTRGSSPADLNHNSLALGQKDGKFENSEAKACEQTELFEIRQIPFGSDQSLLRPQSRCSLPDTLNVAMKIPPGDLKSRLTAWQEKNRQLRTSQYEPYYHGENEEPGQGRSEDLPESESLDEARCCFPPRSTQLNRLSYTSTSSAASEQPIVYSITGLRSRISDATDGDDGSQPDCPSDLAIRTQLYTKNVHAYEPNEGNTKDNYPTSMQSEMIPNSPGIWPVKQQSWMTNSMDNDFNSIMNFSSDTGVSSASDMQGQRRLGAKMDVVYSLLSMLGNSQDREDMSATLLSMSNSVESCIVMKQSGCLPLLIQLIHEPGQNAETRERASRALYNIVHARTDEKSSKREIRVLRLLEQLRDYCQTLRNSLEARQSLEDLEKHPGTTIAALMKLSFDESHRHAMCQLGGLYAVAELIEMDHLAHGSESDDPNCITLRRYAGMALTNLTFGDGNNKALLCSFREFMKALVSQLKSPSDDLRQVTASVLRNLSWRADSSSKQTLREVGAVVYLMKAAMEGRKESTLKSILSALWNLSAHCRTNKMDICAVEGALAFLVDMLSYNAPSKTLAIVENAGGILRNVSSYIAIRDDYRAVVRERGCLQVLLRQLRSPSLTVVSNACGTLWNLSARCPQDQRLLWDLGAVPMLRSLIHSKHKMISMGSSAALKNLFSACPSGSNLVQMDSTARGLGLPTLPSLAARKQKALEQEIDQNLSETCDNIEPSTSPVNKDDKFSFKLDQSFLDSTGKSGLKSFNQLRIQHPLTNQAGPSGLNFTKFPRSESRESMRSVTSTQSDTIFEKVNRQARGNVLPPELQVKQQSTSLHSAVNLDIGNSTSEQTKGLTEKKYTLRYMNAIPERLKPGEPLPDLRGLKSSNSTISWSLTPNHDAACSKGLLHSSIEDNLSISNSSNSSNSKTDINSESNSCHFMSARSKSPFNGVGSYTNYPSSIKNIKKAVHSLKDPLGDYPETNIEQQINCSLNYAEQFINTDKLDSLYLTQTELEHDSIKTTYNVKENTCHSSLNSSGVSSASDLHEESQPKFQQKKTVELSGLHISANKLRPDTHSKIDKGFYSELQNNNGLTSRTDSLPYSTATSDTLTLESDKSLESDSAIFEQVDNFKRIKNNKTKCKVNNGTIVKAVDNINIKNENEYSPNNRIEKNVIIKKDHSENYNFENSFYQSMTNKSSNTIKNITDDISSNDSTLVTSFESLNQQWQDDGQSEITDTNDYFTVQDTYTLGKDIHNQNQNNFVNDDCSISQQCSSTLSFMSIDDENTLSNVMKNEFDSAKNVTASMHTANTANSESCESFDSIERSEQALLELCIKSGIPKTETLLCTISNSKSKSNDDISDLSKKSLSSVNVDDNIHKSTSQVGEVTGKTQEEYRRQRDPDAMIASLDRLTATLVQQSEAMRERDSSTMKGSLLSDTWNEDSPNDVSFPSISVSVPLVASFKSDIQDDQDIAVTDSAEDYHGSTQSMTESKIIEMEAIKLAEAVSAQANQISLTSIDLDAINPPSTMGSLVSLTASIGGITDNADNSGEKSHGQPNSLPLMQLSGGRKKSLPIGVVARRALCQGQNRTGSLENLLNECNNSNHSQLENVKPPSIMDELLDMGDMENSMLSVASITSEIADSKDYSNSLTSSDVVFDLIKPVANILSMTCMRYAETMQGSGNNSLSECLENINPPSLFNEVSQMDESTLESNTHCNDTLCSDTKFSGKESSNTECAVDERLEANDTDDAITPISSECCSSVESTPKKYPHRNQSGHLTPKQKRQLAKERYKTYTIAAERVKKEQEELKKQEQANQGNNEEKNLSNKYSMVTKLTPKQRRQEDRARFQTQVIVDKVVNNDALVPESESPKTPSAEKTTPSSAVKSGIPMLKKFSSTNKGTYKINRNMSRESKDRYRTRTMKDDEETLVCSSENHNENYEMTSKCFSDQSQNFTKENINVDISNTSVGSKGSDDTLSNGRDTTNFQTSELPSTGVNITLHEDTLITEITQIDFLNHVRNEDDNDDDGSKYVDEESRITPITGFCNDDSNENEPRSRKSESEDDSNSNSEKEDEENNETEESRDEENENDDKEEMMPKIKGPRIVKPGTVIGREPSSLESNTSDKQESTSEIPKAIRGRRKALYSKASKTWTKTSTTPQLSSPLRQATIPSSGAVQPVMAQFNRSNSSPPLVRGTRATALRQNNSFQKITNHTTGSTTDKRIGSAANAGKRTSIPQKTPKRQQSVNDSSTKLDTPIKPTLERQGTFTKDEPEMENVPMVASSSPYKGKFSATKSAVKITDKKSPKTSPVHGKSKIFTRVPQRSAGLEKLRKTTSAEKISAPTNIPTIAKRASTNVCSSVIRSASNHQISNGNESAIPRKISLGPRSNSNSSIVSNASTQGNRKVKEAASKIATLWKKVEENRNKQYADKPDTRQWITSDRTQVNNVSPRHPSPPSRSVSSGKNQIGSLYRSSTFEGITKDSTNHSNPAYISPTGKLTTV